MTEAELLVAKFNAQTERVIYTTQEAWDETVSCVGQVSVPYVELLSDTVALWDSFEEGGESV
jgi:hypothetical protein